MLVCEHMKILIQDAVARQHSRTGMADIVRCALIEKMTMPQLDRYFRARRVWWDSRQAAVTNILTGMVFEEESDGYKAIL